MHSCERTPPSDSEEGEEIFTKQKTPFQEFMHSCEREGARTLNQRLKRPLLYH